MKKIRPLNDRILVQRLEAQEKTAGGILIPTNAKEKPSEGRVLAVGQGQLLENGSVRPLTLKEGNRILFGKWSGTEVKIDNNEYLLMKEEDVLAILVD